MPLSVGGMVVRGLGFVNAKTRALATLSAYVLNSAPGVIWFLSFSFLRSRVSGCFMSPKLGTSMLMTSGEYRRSIGGGYKSSFRTA